MRKIPSLGDFFHSLKYMIIKQAVQHIQLLAVL